MFRNILVVSFSRTFFGSYIYRVATQCSLSSLELRVQFCLLVCCTYPSSSTVNKEKNLIVQLASLRVDTGETQQQLCDCFSVCLPPPTPSLSLSLSLSRPPPLPFPHTCGKSAMYVFCFDIRVTEKDFGRKIRRWQKGMAGWRNQTLRSSFNGS